MLIVSGFGFLLIVPPAKDSLSTANFTSSEIILDYMNMGTDDANHIGMISDRLNLNRGVLYNTDATPHLVKPSATNSYPPGWHSANSVLINSVAPYAKSGEEVVWAYVISKFFWFFILVYLLIKTTFSLYALSIGRGTHKKGMINVVFISSVLAFFIYYSVMEQFKEGFYSFIPELISVLLLGLFIFQSRLDKDTYSFNSPMRHRTLLLLVLAVIGGTLSWFLVAPALGLAAIAALLSDRLFSRRLRLTASGNNFVTEIWKCSPLLIIGVTAVALQLYLITSGTARSPEGALNEQGAITLHSSWYYLIILTGIIASYVLYNRKKYLLRLTETSVLIGLILGLSLFIYAINLRSVGQPQYYFFKTLGAAMILAIPLAIIGWTDVMNRVGAGSSVLQRLAIAFSMFSLLVLGVGLQHPNVLSLDYLRGDRTFSPKENAAIIDILDKQGSKAYNEAEVDTVAFIPEQPAYNIIGSTIFTLNLRPTPCHEVVMKIGMTGDLKKFEDTLKSCPNDKRGLTIATRKSALSALKNELQLPTNGNIQIIAID
jgi:hypothetical protein